MSEVRVTLTPDQIRALRETRRRLNFTPDEAKAILRRGEVELQQLLAPDRIKQARNRTVHRSRPTRPQRSTAIGRTKAATSTAVPSRGDPDDDADPHDDAGPWALGLIDRAPFLWRFRAVRGRLLEIREGVDR